ncbi:MAG: LysM peptidoglycan-binding domain-containing protein [Candidatus Dojkabacteria bacterium]
MGTNPNERFYSRNQPKPKSSTLPIEFLKALVRYFAARTRQVLIFISATAEVVFNAGSSVKAWTVQRMFWGRSSLYRSTFHLLVSGVTIVAVLSGISSRLNIISASSSKGLDLTSGIIGRQDIFSQSGTAESISVLASNEPDYPVFRHEVQSGETLSEIAEIYTIKSSTIRWANGMSSDTVRTGQVLRIPGIDGAFIKVKSGDTLEGLAKKYDGNVADIVDLNSSVLGLKNPSLKKGMELFIPGGSVPLPPPVVATRSTYRSSYSAPPSGGVNIPPGTFVNPLVNCPGYSYSRGFSVWHDGVDLAKSGGCWINAAGAGVVTYAGWGNGGQGFHVIINHGNNLYTRYFHGSGSFAVSAGQSVKAGQSIMYMGCSGNCYGTHLHLELSVGDCYLGCTINPETYIRVR